MWYSPKKYDRALRDVNKEILEKKGELSDRDAHITLINFLRHNLYCAVELFSGIKIAAYQEITLKAWFNRNFSLCVWGRGCAKSYMAAVFCFLYSIFNPGSKIIIAGPTFRTARHIFTELEKIVDSKDARILKAAFGYKAKRNDLFEWQISHKDGTVSSIAAIPLSGDKVRGFRANVLIIDEFLLMPKDIVEAVLTPFLSVPKDVAERIKIRQVENQLIKAGQMKEEDKMIFDNNTRVIFLSSASYTFEYLYTKFCEFVDKIKSPEEHSSTYFVSNLGYEAIPEEMLSQEVIQAAKDGGVSHSNFRREFGAEFVDDSEGYYSAKKMVLCTIPDGEEPTLQLMGNSDKKYILSIDPSFSNSPTSDFFAMGVMELDDDKESPTLVHNYAVAGGDLKDHISYLYYIMTNFNIHLIIIDNAGFQFLDSANESELFKKAGISIEFIDFDSDLIGLEYEDMLKKARLQYSKAKIGGKIAIKQNFSSEFIRNANVHLQTCIDHKKVWFGSKLNPNGAALTRQSEVFHKVNKSHIENSVPKDKDTFQSDFIENQDRLINDVKKQCALIEVKSTAKGTQSFDLPLHLKRSTDEDRARKDNYTALLLGAWATKSYYDIMRQPNERATGMFMPEVIN